MIEHATRGGEYNAPIVKICLCLVGWPGLYHGVLGDWERDLYKHSTAQRSNISDIITPLRGADVSRIY